MKHSHKFNSRKDFVPNGKAIYIGGDQLPNFKHFSIYPIRSVWKYGPVRVFTEHYKKIKFGYRNSAITSNKPLSQLILTQKFNKNFIKIE
jgi:hypothetical protein